MMNGLGKRIFRDLKDNFLRWLALFMLIFMGMYIVVSVVGAAENIIVQSRKTSLIRLKKQCGERRV